MAIIFNARNPASLDSNFERGWIELLEGVYGEVTVLADSEVPQYSYEHGDLLILRAPDTAFTAHPEASSLNGLPVAIITMSRHDAANQLDLGSSSGTGGGNWVRNQLNTDDPFFENFDELNYNWDVGFSAQSGTEHTLNPDGDTRVLFWGDGGGSNLGLGYSIHDTELEDRTQWRAFWGAANHGEITEQGEHLFLEFVRFWYRAHPGVLPDRPDLLRDFVFCRTTDVVTPNDEEISVNDVSLLPSNEELEAGNFFLSFESQLTKPPNHETILLTSVQGLTLHVERGHAGTPVLTHEPFTFLRGTVTADMLRRARSVWVRNALPEPESVDIAGETNLRVVRQGFPVYSRTEEQLYILVDGAYIPAAGALAGGIDLSQAALLRMAVEIDQTIDLVRRHSAQLTNLEHIQTRLVDYLEVFRHNLIEVDERATSHQLSDLAVQRRIEEIREGAVLAERRAEAFRQEFHLTQSALEVGKYLPAGVRIPSALRVRRVRARLGQPAEGSSVQLLLRAQATADDLAQYLEPTSSGPDGSIQEYEVQESGTYRLEAWGARGGDSGSNSYEGGLGARMRGEFELEEGDTLLVLVGQEGERTSSGGGTGGGGTFIAKIDPESQWAMQGGDYDGVGVTPLLVAGGGAGRTDSSTYDYETHHGRIDNRGTGGGYSASAAAGGGGGWEGDGDQSTGGKSFLNGGQGGLNSTGDGGFGGGGGKSTTNNSGAGGGGYDGGGRTYDDDEWGGGSFNAGTNQDAEAGVRDGGGLASIAYTPESDDRILVDFTTITIPAGDYERIYDLNGLIPSGTLHFEVTQVGSISSGSGLAIEIEGEKEITQ